MPPDSYQTSFGNHGTRDFAVGSVRGIRQWTFDGRVGAGPVEPVLYGQYEAWQPGVNIAGCLAPESAYTPRPLAGYYNGPAYATSTGQLVSVATGYHYRNTTPDPTCTCGFYAYWNRTHCHLRPVEIFPVTGVIEGYGRVLIGDLGFRCQKARILGLHIIHPAEFLRPTIVRFLKHLELITDQIITDHRSLTCAQVKTAFGNRYGVPLYPSVDELLVAHPLSTDYSPPIEAT
jgi:hypothetical protein